MPRWLPRWLQGLSSHSCAWVGRYNYRYRTSYRFFPKASNMLSATPNDRRAIAPANSPTSRYPGCDTAAQQIDAPERNAGTMPSPSYSHCKLNMPLGAMLCPIAFATLPPPKLCRPSPISISTSSPQLSHLVATGETDTVADSDNQPRQSQRSNTQNSCQRQSAATMMPTKRSHRLHPD